MRLLFIDASTKLKTVRDLETKPRGGMVQSLFKVTDYLATRGHNVSVLSDIESAGKTEAGVNWIHEPMVGSFDVLVSNRGTANGYPGIRAGARVLWTHDLPHNGFIENPKIINAFALTVFMSRYAEGIWRTFYKDIGRSVQIPNGVDKSLFYPRDKDRDYIIYFSHPNRGLKRLPLIADAIKSRLGRDIRFVAYSNAASMYPQESDDHRDHGDQYDLPDYDGNGTLTLRQPLQTRQIAEEVGRAGLCVMPTGYPEICSNSILQALASGTPLVTTGNLGSAPEWVRHRKNGMLTKYQPTDYMVHTVEIVRNAVEVLDSEKLHRKLIKGAARTPILSWDEVGDKWERALSRCC
jgi:glycosyltransferase involved in cell wall biosynthesis